MISYDLRPSGWAWCGIAAVLIATGGVAGAQSGGASGVLPMMPASVLAPDTGRMPAERRFLPATVNEPLMSMTIQVVKEGVGGRSIYRSRHFEFEAPAKLGSTAMKEICRAFESTHELVTRLPWGIVPVPRDGPLFRARLYETREGYVASGAPPWSAASYSLQDGIFHIPFEEVGISTKGGSAASDDARIPAFHAHVVDRRDGGIYLSPALRQRPLQRHRCGGCL